MQSGNTLTCVAQSLQPVNSIGYTYVAIEVQCSKFLASAWHLPRVRFSVP